MKLARYVSRERGSYALLERILPLKGRLDVYHALMVRLHLTLVRRVAIRPVPLGNILYALDLVATPVKQERFLLQVPMNVPPVVQASIHLIIKRV